MQPYGLQFRALLSLQLAVFSSASHFCSIVYPFSLPQNVCWFLNPSTNLQDIPIKFQTFLWLLKSPSPEVPLSKREKGISESQCITGEDISLSQNDC